MNKHLRRFYKLFLNRIPCSNSADGAINKIKVLALKKLFNHICNNVNIMHKIEFGSGSNISMAITLVLELDVL